MFLLSLLDFLVTTIIIIDIIIPGILFINMTLNKIICHKCTIQDMP